MRRVCWGPSPGSSLSSHLHESCGPGLLVTACVQVQAPHWTHRHVASAVLSSFPAEPETHLFLWEPRWTPRGGQALR